MKNFNPKISIALVVRDGEKYIRGAVLSILEQTYENFEFLIIDDGSTDNTKEIVQNYRDARIRLFDNPGPSGKPGGLNFALETSKGEYIALMDADDICFPDRLEKQLKFMERNNHVGIVGGGAILINSHGKQIGKISGRSSRECRYRPFAGSTCFINPTIMIRKSAVYGYVEYDKDYPYAQDYKFFCDCFFHTKFDNLTDNLIQYRIHDSQISSKYSEEQFRLASSIHCEFLARWMREHLCKEDIEKHQAFFRFITRESPAIHLINIVSFYGLLKAKLCLNRYEKIYCVSRFIKRYIDDIEPNGWTLNYFVYAMIWFRYKRKRT